MKPHVVVLGAGFGGLELTVALADALGDQLDVTLIDKRYPSFIGFTKESDQPGHALLDSYSAFA